MNSNRRYLYFAILVVFIGFLLLAFVSYASAEATLLPDGTIIISPDGTSQTLVAAEFLLPRADMEAATTALVNAPIDAKTIAGLRALSDRQQATLNAYLPWATVAAIAAALAGLILGHVAK